MPVLPMCGYVNTTNCPLYDGSVMISWYPVIDVLKTTSPTTPSLPAGAPNAAARQTLPSSSTRRASLVLKGGWEGGGVEADARAARRAAARREGAGCAREGAGCTRGLLERAGAAEEGEPKEEEHEGVTPLVVRGARARTGRGARAGQRGATPARSPSAIEARDESIAFGSKQGGTRTGGSAFFEHGGGKRVLSRA